MLGMGTFASGDLMTTKPYISGAAYIKRMSDYCEACVFDPGKDCPITSLYCAFLERHRQQLADNPRLRMSDASLKRRSPERRRRDAIVYAHVSGTLAKGQQLRPDGLPPAGD